MPNRILDIQTAAFSQIRAQYETRDSGDLTSREMRNNIRRILTIVREEKAVPKTSRQRWWEKQLRHQLRIAYKIEGL